MTLEERMKQLRAVESGMPAVLSRAGRNAALRAIQKAAEETPPRMNDLRGTNTRSGELKQHWATDSRPDPVRRGDGYVSTLANDLDYASYVNDGHRMDRHFVPGLYVNPYSKLLEYDPAAETGLVVGTKTLYVPGEFMTDKGREAYEKTVLEELDRRIQEVLR